TRNPAARPDDHLAADLLAEDAVGGADVVAPFGRDRRRLEAESGLSDRCRGLVDDAVLGRAAALEREVEARELEPEPGDLGVEDAQRLLEQLLARLVPLEHHDRFLRHRYGH